MSGTTEGTPAMTGRHSGFSYQCIIGQHAIYAKVMGFDHVMTPEWLLGLSFLTDGNEAMSKPCWWFFFCVFQKVLHPHNNVFRTILLSWGTGTVNMV